VSRHPLIQATHAQIQANETTYLKCGRMLFELDPEDPAVLSLKIPRRGRKYDEFK